ncbi:MAG: hypothetical protein Q9225_006073 [Loekoesia sp. 1 TL-2023]
MIVVQVKQREPTGTGYTGTPIGQANLRYKQSSEFGQTIAGLQWREKQIRDSIRAIELSFGDAENPAPRREGSFILPSPETQLKKRMDDAHARKVTTIIKDIERATQRDNVAWVSLLWQKYQRWPVNAGLDWNSREVIYMHFLSAFFALSRQEQAIHVWNDMLQANITPNEKHWNAMLKGCSKAHDATSLQEVWNNMISTGIEPDVAHWTTYIHGLIMSGRWQRGLEVLDDLGTKWKTANMAQVQPHSLADYDPNKPSLAPVQAAILALTITQRHELCLPLLDWAKVHSLPLTTEIFNILLRPAVRSGDTKKTAHILSLMNNNQCPADGATYTILLNGHMSNINSNFSRLSSQEQQDSILQILEDMAANKIAIDRRTYGTILRSLLSSNNAASNDDAVQAILEHMAKKNVNPDSYIYHMLVSYRFAQDPPDVAAVETIWARIKVERPSLQSVFYEKMVEGYAKVKAVERMMFFLRRIVREGNSPRWRCLTNVLNTLIETGEWSLAKELVEDVRDTKNGLMRYADSNVSGNSKEEFWSIVEDVKDRIEQEARHAHTL